MIFKFICFNIVLHIFPNLAPESSTETWCMGHNVYCHVYMNMNQILRNVLFSSPFGEAAVLFTTWGEIGCACVERAKRGKKKKKEVGGEGESMQPFYPKAAFSWDHTKNSSRRLDWDVKQSLPAVLNVIHACSPFCTSNLPLRNRSALHL